MTEGHLERAREALGEAEESTKQALGATKEAERQVASVEAERDAEGGSSPDVTDGVDMSGGGGSGSGGTKSD